jgi:hypothetical protein
MSPPPILTRTHSRQGRVRSHQERMACAHCFLHFVQVVVHTPEEYKDGEKQSPHVCSFWRAPRSPEIILSYCGVSGVIFNFRFLLCLPCNQLPARSNVRVLFLVCTCVSMKVFIITKHGRPLRQGTHESVERFTVTCKYH